MHKLLTTIFAVLGLLIISVTTAHARPNGVYFLQCDEGGNANLIDIGGGSEPYGGCAGGPWTIKVIWYDGEWVPSAGPGGGGNIFTHRAELISALEDLTDQAIVERNDREVLFFRRQIEKQKNIMRKLLDAR